MLWHLVAQMHAMQQLAPVSSRGTVRVHEPKHSTALVPHEAMPNTPLSRVSRSCHMSWTSLLMWSLARSAHLRVL